MRKKYIFALQYSLYYTLFYSHFWGFLCSMEEKFNAAPGDPGIELVKNGNFDFYFNHWRFKYNSVLGAKSI